jgi:hypothetical protein
MHKTKLTNKTLLGRNLASLILSFTCRGKSDEYGGFIYLAWEASVLPLNYTRVLVR